MINVKNVILKVYSKIIECVKVQVFEICEPETPNYTYGVCIPPQCIIQCGDEVCAYLVDDNVCVF